MTWLRRVLLAIAVMSVPLHAHAQNPTVPGRVVRETELDRQVEKVASELRCVVCKGQSLQDSPAEFAQDMRAIIREQLAAGRTPDEVKAYFMERYGEWVMLEPPARGFNLVVYIAPVLMLLGGAAFVYFKARSLTRVGAVQESAGT